MQTLEWCDWLKNNLAGDKPIVPFGVTKASVVVVAAKDDVVERSVVGKQAARRVEAPDSRLVFTPHVVGSVLKTLVGLAKDHDEHIAASGQCRTFAAGEQYSLCVEESITVGVVSHQKSWPIDKSQDRAHDVGDGGVSV